jgi:hypothetical protein
MTVPLMSTMIVLGPSAADNNARSRTALLINLSNREYRPPLQPWRLTQSRRTALERRPREQTNRLLLAAADPASPATVTEPWPLSP